MRNGRGFEAASRSRHAGFTVGKDRATVLHPGQRACMARVRTTLWLVRLLCGAVRPKPQLSYSKGFIVPTYQ